MKKIFVVSKTHLDLGFTDYAENIRRKYIDDYIPSAVSLAEEVNTSRLEVSRELNKMQEEGLVTLARGRITIPFLERFVTL